jgi:hypothetical protein
LEIREKNCNTGQQPECQVLTVSPYGREAVISDGRRLGKYGQVQSQLSQPELILRAMRANEFIGALFRPRPDASPVAYWIMFLPAALMALFAAHEGWEAVVPEVILIGFCILQIKFRTYFGWALLLGLWTLYSLEILPEIFWSNTNDFIFLMIIGPLPLIPILLSRPKFTTKRNVIGSDSLQESPAGGNAREEI